MNSSSSQPLNEDFELEARRHQHMMDTGFDLELANELDPGTEPIVEVGIKEKDLTTHGQCVILSESTASLL